MSSESTKCLVKLLVGGLTGFLLVSLIDHSFMISESRFQASVPFQFWYTAMLTFSIEWFGFVCGALLSLLRFKKPKQALKRTG